MNKFCRRTADLAVDGIADGTKGWWLDFPSEGREGEACRDDLLLPLARTHGLEGNANYLKASYGDDR